MHNNGYIDNWRDGTRGPWHLKNILVARTDMKMNEGKS